MEKNTAEHDDALTKLAFVILLHHTVFENQHCSSYS